MWGHVQEHPQKHPSPQSPVAPSRGCVTVFVFVPVWHVSVSGSLGPSCLCLCLSLHPWICHCVPWQAMEEETQRPVWCSGVFPQGPSGLREAWAEPWLRSGIRKPRAGEGLGDALCTSFWKRENRVHVMGWERAEGEEKARSGSSRRAVHRANTG